jgi:acetyltransferase-like isoleucine patch superfamily enzyme
LQTSIEEQHLVKDPGTIKSPAFPDGLLPPNMRVGGNTIITGGRAFLRFFSQRDDAIIIGDNSTLNGVSFAIGKNGILAIGNYCFLSGAVLLCECEIKIGNFVSLGWNATIADSDFHPIEPAQRMEDAIACSNIAHGRERPVVAASPVVIEDDVWIGPNATILKGVRIGAGSFIEPGALVTRDIPPGSRVIGNPARIVGGV